METRTMETLMCTLESIYQDYRQPRDYQTLPTWLLWKFTCHTLIICNISCDVKRASTNNEFDTLNNIIGCYSKGTSGAALFCLRQYWSRRFWFQCLLSKTDRHGNKNFWYCNERRTLSLTYRIFYLSVLVGLIFSTIFECSTFCTIRYWR